MRALNFYRNSTKLIIHNPNAPFAPPNTAFLVRKAVLRESVRWGCGNLPGRLFDV
jgi:hypothetical protein